MLEIHSLQAFKSLASAYSTTRAYRIYILRKSSAQGSCRAFWRRHPDLNRGIKVLQTLALPLGYSAVFAAPCRQILKKKQYGYFGAGNEIRTRDIHLGKVTLYH